MRKPIIVTAYTGRTFHLTPAEGRSTYGDPPDRRETVTYHEVPRRGCAGYLVHTPSGDLLGYLDKPRHAGDDWTFWRNRDGEIAMMTSIIAKTRQAALCRI